MITDGDSAIMINTKKAQKEVYQNKVNHGFNLTDINMEFCLLNAEVGEAYMAWLKKKDDTGEETQKVLMIQRILQIKSKILGEKKKKKLLSMLILMVIINGR